MCENSKNFQLILGEALDRHSSDPIHDQSFYLTTEKTAKEHGIVGYSIVRIN